MGKLLLYSGYILLVKWWSVVCTHQCAEMLDELSVQYHDEIYKQQIHCWLKFFPYMFFL